MGGSGIKEKERVLARKVGFGCEQNDENRERRHVLMEKGGLGKERGVRRW